MNTILIIDDNKAYREGLIEVLNSEGYLTLGAKNGLLGLQIIRELSPSLILCDVDMPVMDGLEVLRIIKLDPKLSIIPFLILSGGDGDGERVIKMKKDLEEGAYMIKGLSIPDLLSKIAYFLNPISPPEKAYL